VRPLETAATTHSRLSILVGPGSKYDVTNSDKPSQFSTFERMGSIDPGLQAGFLDLTESRMYAERGMCNAATNFAVIRSELM
jgi:hypothetical protein